jgi:hypothetical protein
VGTCCTESCAAISAFTSCTQVTASPTVVLVVSTVLVATSVALSTTVFALAQTLSTKFVSFCATGATGAAGGKAQVIGSGFPSNLAKNLARNFTARSKAPSVGTTGVAGAEVGATVVAATGADDTQVGIHSGIFTSGVIAIE